MAATQTVPQHLHHFNREPIVPRHGVITLFGYGIRVRVERGHLIVEDGIGARHSGHFPRVRHGIRRLVIIGSDGIVSLSAIRWLADQDVAFVMLERDGTVLTTTGPVRPSDARLRRAQALAHHSGIALKIARELIRQKLSGQERLARELLKNSRVAEFIAKSHAEVDSAGTIQAIRQIEAQAAQAYWSAWRNLRVIFPTKDLRRVPDHWRTFGSRKSPLTGSPRLAATPTNAMLNYLYALLESESRLALAALGLDPGIGVLHVDTPSRDSLACDLMESVRPQVDAYLFDWISHEPLRREWFFEKHDGNCRLMGSFAAQLSETASTWGRAIAPVAEWVSRTLWSTIRKTAQQVHPATRLTQSRRRQTRGGSPAISVERPPRPPRVCVTCGVFLKSGRRYCATCGVAFSKEGLIEAARLGRLATHTAKSEALRASTMKRQEAAKRAWRLSDLPEWLSETFYREKIQPRLWAIKVPIIATDLIVSKPYATDIRKGRRIPHPRHWLTLSRLVGISTNK
jgi:CRISPR-associated protein Cas1